MLNEKSTYAELVNGFRWDLPDRFNIGEAVCSAWARRVPDQVAIIEHMDDGPARRTTYGELEAMANRIANLLASRGVSAGDRVALLLPQCRETAAAHVAIYKMGAIAVPLAMLFGVEALQYRLQNSGAKALLMSHASRTTLQKSDHRLKHWARFSASTESWTLPLTCTMPAPKCQTRSTPSTASPMTRA
jgi:acetyl-CoA synthetase